MFFCMKINIKVFYKLVVLFLLTMTRHVQNTQNSKFAKYLLYLKNEVRDKVIFLQ